MKRTMKKVGALALTLVMLLGTLAVMPFGVSAEENDAVLWDGSTIEDWGNLAGSGTEEDPYLIEDPVDWIAMILGAGTWTQTDNQYFKLTADLDFGGRSINAISVGVAIKLDGAGHTIYNYNAVDGYAIARYFFAGTVIKNLNFVNLQLSAKNAAGLARDTKGATLIENVYIDGTSVIKTTDISNTGAAAGFVCFGYGDLTVRNCVNEAAVIGGYQAGAFLATIASNADFTFENCINVGEITCGYDAATGTINSYKIGSNVAAFVGSTGSKSVFDLTIKNCANLGDIIGGSTAQTNVGAFFGGSYGYDKSTQAYGASTITVENSYNAGDLYAYGNISVMGAVSPMPYYAGTLILKNVYSIGSLYPDEDARRHYVNAMIGLDYNDVYAATFQNLYALDDGIFGLHGCQYADNTYKVYEYCDLVADVNTSITLATNYGTRKSTIADEIDAIDAIIELALKEAVCAAGGHNFEYGCSTTCDDCGATRNKSCEKEFSCSDACRYCGAEMPAGDHTYEGVVITEPTHTTEGVKVFTCACGETYTEALAKTEEHDAFGAWISVNEDIHKSVCACGEEVLADHEWDDGVVTTPATHKDKGVKLYTCTECNQTKLEEIEKVKDHVWDEGVITTPATHKNKGEKTYTCFCGKTKKEKIDKIKDHIWDDGKITIEPTHATEGEKLYSCTICDTIKTETIAKDEAHVFDRGEMIDDNTHKQFCACGAEDVAEHTWNKGEITTPATETEEGVKTFTCTVCGCTKTEAVAFSAGSNDSDDDDSSPKLAFDVKDIMASNGCSASVGAPILLLTLAAVPFVMKRKKED